jgi:hypothetical protein
MKKSARPARRKRPRRPAQQVVSLPDADRLDPDLPAWLPLDYLSPHAERAVAQVIRPAYRRFVLEAPGELERTVGASLVYLVWLEVMNQTNLAKALANPHSAEAIMYDTDSLTERYLTLLAAKTQTADLMLKVRLADEAIHRMAAAQDPPNSFPLLESASPLSLRERARVRAEADNSGRCPTSPATENGPAPLAPEIGNSTIC